MPREIITVQVGQCGNQIGARFWDTVLREHAGHCSDPIYDDALSTFFVNHDQRSGSDIPIGSGKSAIKSLKARAVLVDLEERVLDHVLSSKLGELFTGGHLIKDDPGSGNNWAKSFCEFGPRHRDHILQQIHSAAERCDSLQAFFMVHSLGGGTGSGLGPYILSMLEDEFPSCYRFAASVFPQAEGDDVVTSPYNSIFSLSKLTEHADCVLPFDNTALTSIIQRQIELAKKDSSLPQPPANAKRFALENGLVASFLSNLTSSMRFDGLLNVDINEITTNMV